MASPTRLLRGASALSDPPQHEAAQRDAAGEHQCGRPDRRERFARGIGERKAQVVVVEVAGDGVFKTYQRCVGQEIRLRACVRNSIGIRPAWPGEEIETGIIHMEPECENGTRCK